MSKPYRDHNNIRIFNHEDIRDSDLVWHTDKENRVITVLEGEGWRFQRDNELPMYLSKGDKLKIPEGQIHRILKGTTDLVIKIEK
jgi:quercetin dioxygenase-like cupin family protein